MHKRIKEITLTKEQAIAEAKRYLANAKETIAKSPIGIAGKIYEDSKYVREGAAMAYLAALKAIDGWLLGKGTPNEKLPKSIDEYWAVRRKIPHNGKFTEDLTIVYQNLHLGAYYQGFVDINFVKNGLRAVKEIISMLE
ncbi:MAG: hypothetical protein A2X61_09270 [Ignavibacteria bacterium GWB2_35_12]|nr:MAG: hypothetical protein A2X63_02855 [Ignavibacteria bacterium GWA2_35_8]OGU38168.1 MAG: hypothetical protein A2X61_09270 [Ignavibacteria bacterium GWB2_35_12]OGU94337.1 MAG: hypothetical protein A2220_14320 [Ignavibacteria bacterium RIFOXYA2_FULL_35_10]OGV20025.1 MAG: hypothetical protein A2475_02995 [Ignavibacteria bacterium RIFOXYC2_FULL_35_21]